VEVSAAVISIVLGAGAGVASAAIFLWRAGASWAEFKTKTETAIKSMEEDIDENQTQIEELAHETRAYAREQGQAWTQLNRTLGQIEGGLNSRSRKP